MQFLEAPTNFYLGARVDPQTGRVVEGDAVYYDSRDLTTHGVVVGMTGSGKTGLCVDILEEAVIDGIPAIVIDPKGDITNLLLAFPELTPDYFRPWINPDDALRSDQSVDEYAATVAQRWREGLAYWGITEERVREFRNRAEFSIYTPGSESGLSVSILQSFAAPRQGWQGNEEMLRERISGTVTALLALIGITARPVEDREHILLANLFEYNWRNGQDMTLEKLIQEVQQPPFAKLGMFEVETLFPEKDRFQLAQRLNNLIAAPNFQSWIQGQPLDIPSLLFTSEGRPRVSIFYTAHLNDAERMFIITLLLEGVLAWMRTLTGTTSLRGLLYIDEVFGMFPPHPFNPPTKQPLMRLLKQARAYGIGVLMATQNPKDLDYKGLSNAGTWFIGKLQTDIDKERILEGLDSVRDATSMWEIADVDRQIGALGPRQFILHDVHNPESPILMTTRWAMSYLRGPVTRDQVATLMTEQKQRETAAQPQAQPAAAYAAQPQPGVMPGYAPQAAYSPPPTYSTPGVAVAMPSGPTTTETGDIPPGFSSTPPRLPSGLFEYYIPTEITVEQAIRGWEEWSRQPAASVQTRRRLLYRAALISQCNVRFEHRPSDISELRIFAFVVPSVPRVPHVNWYDYYTDPFDPHLLDPQPLAEPLYADVPDTLTDAAALRMLKQDLIEWLYQNARLTIFYNPVLNIYSGLDTSYQDFQVQAQAIARERRDQEVDKVASQYDKRLASLENRAQQKNLRLAAERDELEARKREEVLSAGESLMQLMRGRSLYTLSRTSRMRRYTSTSQDQASLYEAQVESIRADFEQTEREMQASLQAVQDKWSTAASQVEEVDITPYKKNVTLSVFGLAWVPYWDVVINGEPAILPASLSALSEAQQSGY